MLPWRQPENRCFGVPARDAERHHCGQNKQKTFEKHVESGSRGRERGVGAFEIGEGFVYFATEFGPFCELVLGGGGGELLFGCVDFAAQRALRGEGATLED